MRSDTDLAPPETETRRRGPGPRTQRRLTRERAERRRRRRIVLAVTLAVAVVVGVLALFVGLPGDGPERETGAGGREPPAQEAWLLIGTVEADPSKTASWLSVFSWDREEGRGFIMYVPPTTLIEIPGYGGGPEAAGKAMALGQEPLQVSAISNLLGIGFAHPMTISDQSIRALFDRIGGIDIEVPSPLERRDAGGRVETVFATGPQHMDGKRVAEYLEFSDPTGDEISRGARHAQVWGAFFEHFRRSGKAPALSKLVRASKDLFVTDADPKQMSEFVSNFASVPAGDVVLDILPVEPQGIDTGLQFYKPDAAAVQTIIHRYLDEARPAGAGEPGRRVQILNGNGVPGIGQEVAAALVPAGFRVVLDGNAKSFDYETTQIVVYSNSRDALAIAGKVRDALGAGEVVVSRQRQTVVDVTVVVGRDYPRG